MGKKNCFGKFKMRHKMDLIIQRTKSTQAGSLFIKVYFADRYCFLLNFQERAIFAPGGFSVAKVQSKGLGLRNQVHGSNLEGNF
jgi:hypothetical protein